MASRSLKLALAVLLLIAILEFSLTLAGYRANKINLGGYHFDPDIGWVRPKSQALYRANWAFGHFVYYQENGDPQTSAGLPRPRPGKSSVVIGDSFAEGFYVPYEDSFAFQLAKLWSDTNFRNLGVAGYSPEQYVLAARQALSKDSVQRILVFLYAFNDVPYVDVANLYGLYYKPVLDESAKRTLNTPLPQPLISGMEQNKKFPAIISLLLPLFGSFMAKEDLPIPALALDTPFLAPKKLDRTIKILQQIKTDFPSPCFQIVYVPSYWEFKELQLNRNRELFFASCKEQKAACLWPMDFTQTQNWREYYWLRDNQKHFNAKGSAKFYAALEKQLQIVPGCAP